MKLETRQEILTRAAFKCELCYGSLQQMSVHHRRPRQMGGSKASWINDHENLLALCGSGTTGCHGYVESRRSDAYEFGWLVRSGFDPHLTPFCDRRGHWWLLYKNLKLPFALPFETPNPSSVRPALGIGLVNPVREETYERPF